MTFDAVLILMILAISAYAFQALLTMRQLKHFTKIYRQIRQKGKVAIGRKSGGIKAGTIVFMAINAQGVVQETQIMQGISIFARFKQYKLFDGEELIFLDRKHPKVRQLNQLIQLAIEDARDTYVKVSEGVYVEPSRKGMIDRLIDRIKQTVNQNKT